MNVTRAECPPSNAFLQNVVKRWVFAFASNALTLT